MKRIILIGLLLIKSICSLAYTTQFDTIVVFGDSLSDNGNLYRYFLHFIPLSPPYFFGHFSNGPLWVEYLYQDFFPQDYAAGLQDYAVGGAGAILSYKENLPFTLTAELDDYLYWNTYDHKETSLFALWIGANNYINGPSNIDELTDDVVAAISGVLERIIANGGDKFLIINLPDLAQLPQARLLTDPSLLTALTLAHNSKLKARIEALKNKYPQVLFLFFDAFNFFSQAKTHAADYGIDNLIDPCYLGSYSGWLINLKPSEEQLFNFLKNQNAAIAAEQWAIISKNPQLHQAVQTAYNYTLLPAAAKEEELHCERYLFWDQVHPTTVVHRLIASQVTALIQDAGLKAFWPQSLAINKVNDGRSK